MKESIEKQHFQSRQSSRQKDLFLTILTFRIQLFVFWSGFKK